MKSLFGNARFILFNFKGKTLNKTKRFLGQLIFSRLPPLTNNRSIFFSIKGSFSTGGA